MTNLQKSNALEKVKKTPELTRLAKKRGEIRNQIRQNKKGMEDMLDFSMGFRFMPKKYKRTEEDENRMMETFKNLHTQNHEMKEWLKEKS